MTDSAWWRPDALARRRPYLEARSNILNAMRGLFAARGFTEVETPALQVSPGLEPHLKAFATRLDLPGEETAPRYLHTSPEFAMKKLLVAGMPRIFQLTHCFRNAERGATHSPEFAMLEWYRAGATYLDLVGDCEALLRAAGTRLMTWQGRVCDPHGAWERLTVAEAFSRHCGIDVLATIDNRDALAAASLPLGIAPHQGDSWEDLFFRIFLAAIEPKLGIGVPTVLYDYPIEMAALARPKASDPTVCERFELYVCGLELANAFGELTDAAEQRRRFEADVAKKRDLYGETYPIDGDFLAALAHGMPESAGIALGFDRLVMLASGATHIDDVLWAPVR
ncbi:MAG TPA: EF-P lysine aminoacylase EpmA [Stellaceae bacterium]|jgi:lysyl-tRNA synthetase class 2|nr:EF-P lysine aminoacylase EpmA [Stellaceae bacterium]